MVIPSVVCFYELLTIFKAFLTFFKVSMVHGGPNKGALKAPRSPLFGSFFLFLHQRRSIQANAYCMLSEKYLEWCLTL